jgi:hypothetical protein
MRYPPFLTGAFSFVFVLALGLGTACSAQQPARREPPAPDPARSVPDMKPAATPATPSPAESGSAESVTAPDELPFSLSGTYTGVVGFAGGEQEPAVLTILGNQFALCTASRSLYGTISGRGGPDEMNAEMKFEGAAKQESLSLIITRKGEEIEMRNAPGEKATFAFRGKPRPQPIQPPIKPVLPNPPRPPRPPRCTPPPGS